MSLGDWRRAACSEPSGGFLEEIGVDGGRPEDEVDERLDSGWTVVEVKEVWLGARDALRAGRSIGGGSVDGPA